MLQSRPIEQDGLGGFVCGFVAVIIQMIAREIGEQADVEMQAVQATLMQANRRRLDGQCLRAGIAQCCCQPGAASSTASGVV